jgi:predicted nucleotidyltransferase
VTGEHLAPDIREFVRLLHVHGVRYLIVGGEAVIHHGYPRLTGDVDFFFERTPANVRRLYAALEEFWGGSVPAVAGAQELLEPDVIVQFGRPPNRIDLIGSLGTVRFAGAWRRRVEERIEIEGEEPLPLHIIGLSDLLRAKRDAGRPKDLDDIEHLRALHRGARRR